MAKDVAVYEIGGLEYRQTYLTIDSAMELAGLVDTENPPKMNALAIVSYLKKKNVLDRAFNILLEGETPVKMADLKLSTALEVVEDFLSSPETSLIITRLFSLAGNVTGLITQLTGKVVDTTANLTGIISSPSLQTGTSPSTGQSGKK